MEKKQALIYVFMSHRHCIITRDPLSHVLEIKTLPESGLQYIKIATIALHDTEDYSDRGYTVI